MSLIRRIKKDGGVVLDSVKASLSSHIKNHAVPGTPAFSKK